MSISRCTQNATFMEEWRKGWHPEKFDSKGESESVLVVGSGPAGLEAARVLGERGYQVAIAESKNELGGRVALERKLPGLSAWGRVADYRQYQISQMANIETYLDSELSADQILEFGFEHVALATGACWRSDGVSRYHVTPMTFEGDLPIYTPDDLMGGQQLSGNVVLFDDDHYYMGGVLAELIVGQGANVTLVTPSAYVSEWTNNTLEQATIHQRLCHLNVAIELNQAVTKVIKNGVELACTYTDSRRELQADAVVLVTSQVSNNSVWLELKEKSDQWAEHGIKSIKPIGDADAPAPIAWATYAGHRYAREMDNHIELDALPFKREVINPG